MFVGILFELDSEASVNILPFCKFIPDALHILQDTFVNKVGVSSDNNQSKSLSTTI